eukprot:CCRYP_013810-RA/>CCRYP_013810-RA protein AED:0.00 eAED:0.00 QI:236/-1/1/1/-1/1/1/370/148
MTLNECRRMLRYYAENNPKASTAAMLAATTLTLTVFVVAIDARDERAARRLNNVNSSPMASSNPTPLSPNEAKVSAMIENARKSTWRENLENAADAHQRFVLSNHDVDHGKELPQYVKRIDERSEELMMEEEERLQKRRDPSNTWFWR